MGTVSLSAADEVHLRATFAAARALAAAGQLPFSARLVDGDGVVGVEAGNEVAQSGDPTAHAEIVLLRRAVTTMTRDALGRSTLYAAAEPCAMCAAAIVWSGVGRVVYGLRADRVRLRDPLPRGMAEPGVHGRALFDATAHGPVVVGPALEEAADAHLFPRRDT